MKKNVLRLFIEQTLKDCNLLEADRFTRETGRRFNMQKEIEKYVDVFENDIAKYAFTMTSVAKVGINPKFGYNTPRGIYAYPLTSEMFQELKHDELPFVSDAPYFTVFEIKDVSSMLVVSGETDGNLDYEEVEEICEKIYDDAIPLFDKGETLSFYNIIEYSESTPENSWWRVCDDAKIYAFCLSLLNLKISNKSDHNGVLTSLLRKAGYSGIYDSGEGIIHPSEQTQLVIFSKQSIETVEMFETAAFRKSRLPFVDRFEDLGEDIKFKLAKETDKQSILAKLANDKNDYIRGYVASNKNTTSKILHDLAVSELKNNGINDKFLMMNIAKNPKTDLKTLEMLFSDHLHRLNSAIKKNIKQRE